MRDDMCVGRVMFGGASHSQTVVHRAGTTMAPVVGSAEKYNKSPRLSQRGLFWFCRSGLRAPARLGGEPGVPARAAVRPLVLAHFSKPACCGLAGELA